MREARIEDRDRVQGALLGAALGEALARRDEAGAPPDTGTLERRLRADRWSLGPGGSAVLSVGQRLAAAGFGAEPPALHFHGTGDELDLLPALPVALVGAFAPSTLRERVTSLFAGAPARTTEAAIAFALLVAALFDGDRLAALDEACEAAPSTVGMAVRSAPLEDAERLETGEEPLRSLTAGVWAFYQAESAVDALLIAARIGLGSLCGGICGALAGAWWGRSGLPAELTSKLGDSGIGALGDRLCGQLARATVRHRPELHG